MKYTLHCEPENIILAARAGQMTGDKPLGTLSTVEYESSKFIYVCRRTMAGYVIVNEIAPQSEKDPSE